MGAVDYAKKLLPRVLDRLMPVRVVFHHVPKCGGTSVGRSLRTRYLLSQGTVTPESSFRAFEAFTGRSDRERMLVDVLDLREQMMLYLMFEDVRCISLHVRFSEAAFARFSPGYKFVTILREPISRFVSHYFWSYGKPHAHARIEEEFEDFLETERARRIGSTYPEYFSGLPKDADFTSREAIDAAVANLRRFDVVGLLDDIPQFERDLRRVLRVRVRIGHENRGESSGSGRRSALLAEHRDRIAEVCAPDIDVWKRYLQSRSRLPTESAQPVLPEPASHEGHP